MHLGDIVVRVPTACAAGWGCRMGLHVHGGGGRAAGCRPLEPAAPARPPRARHERAPAAALPPSRPPLPTPKNERTTTTRSWLIARRRGCRSRSARWPMCCATLTGCAAPRCTCWGEQAPGEGGCSRCLLAGRKWQRQAGHRSPAPCSTRRPSRCHPPARRPPPPSSPAITACTTAPGRSSTSGWASRRCSSSSRGRCRTAGMRISRTPAGASCAWTAMTSPSWAGRKATRSTRLPVRCWKPTTQTKKRTRRQGWWGCSAGGRLGSAGAQAQVGWGAAAAARRLCPLPSSAPR